MTRVIKIIVVFHNVYEYLHISAKDKNVVRRPDLNPDILKKQNKKNKNKTALHLSFNTHRILKRINKNTKRQKNNM